MGKRSEWLDALKLMRIPFSIFLMPVYWFALVNAEADVGKAILVFITLHLFVYPASNGYNSYFDRDEQSIGGLKHPPKVTKQLWYLVVLFDFLSIVFASFVSFPFALMVCIYLLISKAYSYDKVRLKKYPVVGALTVVFFQGFFTYLAVQIGVATSEIFIRYNLLFGMVSSLFLLGSYPMTQIYQHEEDAKHGDRSLSMLLGISGTFIFTAVVFFIASLMMIILFWGDGRKANAAIYVTATLPVLIYFSLWYLAYRKGRPVITFERTMRLNILSSLMLSAGFIAMILLKV